MTLVTEFHNPQVDGGGKSPQGEWMTISMNVIVQLSLTKQVHDAIWVIMNHPMKICRDKLRLKHRSWYDYLKNMRSTSKGSKFDNHFLSAIF